MDKPPSAIRRWRGFYEFKEITGFSLKGSIYRTLKVINDQLKRNNKATTVFHWVAWLENYPAELLTGIIKNEKDILKPLMATQIPPP